MITAQQAKNRTKMLKLFIKKKLSEPLTSYLCQIIGNSAPESDHETREMVAARINYILENSETEEEIMEKIQNF